MQKHRQWHRRVNNSAKQKLEQRFFFTKVSIKIPTRKVKLLKAQTQQNVKKQISKMLVNHVALQVTTINKTDNKTASKLVTEIRKMLKYCNCKRQRHLANYRVITEHSHIGIHVWKRFTKILHDVRSSHTHQPCSLYNPKPQTANV